MSISQKRSHGIRENAEVKAISSNSSTPRRSIRSTRVGASVIWVIFSSGRRITNGFGVKVMTIEVAARRLAASTACRITSWWPR